MAEPDLSLLPSLDAPIVAQEPGEAPPPTRRELLDNREYNPRELTDEQLDASIQSGEGKEDWFVNEHTEPQEANRRLVDFLGTPRPGRAG